jgi:hypothetical protein
MEHRHAFWVTPSVCEFVQVVAINHDHESESADGGNRGGDRRKTVWPPRPSLPEECPTDEYEQNAQACRMWMVNPRQEPKLFNQTFRGRWRLSGSSSIFWAGNIIRVPSERVFGAVLRIL